MPNCHRKRLLAIAGGPFAIEKRYEKGVIDKWVTACGVV